MSDHTGATVHFTDDDGYSCSGVIIGQTADGRYTVRWDVSSTPRERLPETISQAGYERWRGL